MLLAWAMWVRYEWTRMIRKQLMLGLLATLLLACSASAQSTQQGEGNANGGSGSGNVQSGAGQVATPPAATPRPQTTAPRPTATPYRAAPTPAPTVSKPRPATRAPARPAPAKPKPKPRKPSSRSGLAGGISTNEARCLSPLERTVLRCRAKGRPVTAIAAELDMAKGAVSAAEQSGLRRLVVRSGARRCAKSSSDQKAASTSKERRVSQTVLAKQRRAAKKRDARPSEAPQSAPVPAVALLPEKGGGGGLLLLLLGLLGLLAIGMGLQLYWPALAMMRRERSIRRDPFNRRGLFKRR